MNQPRSIFTMALVLSAVLMGAAASFGQKVEPSYEVSLQVVIGSNDASQRGELPASLSIIPQELIQERAKYLHLKID